MTAVLELNITDESARTLSTWFNVDIMFSAIKKLPNGHTSYLITVPLQTAFSIQKVLKMKKHWWEMN